MAERRFGAAVVGTGATVVHSVLSPGEASRIRNDRALKEAQ